MTEREFDQRLRTWYRRRVESVGPMPPTLHEQVVSIPDRVPALSITTGRRRLIIMAAAAMLIVALMMGTLAIGSLILRLPRPDSEITPNLPPKAWTDQLMTPLPPGSYYLDLPVAGSSDDIIRVTFRLPLNWERVRIDGLVWGQTTWVSIVVPTNVYVEGCEEHALARPPIGPTAGDLAAALHSAAGWTIKRTSDASLDGYTGKRVELVGPTGIANCIDDARLLRFPGLPGYVPALRDREPATLWILDVGDARLVIWEGGEPDATAGALAERRALVDSIDIQRLPGLALPHRRGSSPD
jgi:hypothetical protein